MQTSYKVGRKVAHPNARVFIKKQEFRLLTSVLNKCILVLGDFMMFQKIGNIMEGQDGAIWNNLLFRFNHAGKCAVYNLDTMRQGDSTALCHFELEKTEVIKPHSNSVFFGNEYFKPDDEFPLLYTNVYNNYSNCEERKIGVCCVYRIFRKDGFFQSKLVQTIEIGFTEDQDLWCSPDKNDVRPYGNFTADTNKNILYAFVMRDGYNTTRYFCFKMPTLDDGVYDSEFGVKRVILEKQDIIGFFDCQYHRFIQGVCCNKGKIYSLEGFGHDQVNSPAMRVINPEKQEQELFELFDNFDSPTEPEFIDFASDVCYYADNPGNLYILSDI